MRKHVLSSIAPLLIAGTALTVSACREAEPEAAAAPASEHRVDVPALTVSATNFESTLEISGNLLPQTRVSIFPKQPGTVSRVTVEIGDRVRAGQPVAFMDRRDIDAQVDAATAALNVAHAGLESAEAALANANVEAERAQKLFESGAIAKQRLDAADTSRRSATAQRELANANVAQAEAALRRAREVQRDATLASPIDGVVVERHYDAGSLAAPSDKPIVVVADLRVLKLEAGVSELEAGRLRVGMPARISVQARPGDTFDGRLAAIAPEVDPRNRHFTIEVRMNNPGALLSGMYATAAIATERMPDAIAIPRDAVTSRGGRLVVYRIDGTEVHEVAITQGLVNATQVQVSSGVKAGDVLVADARRDVAPGARVNAVFSK